MNSQEIKIGWLQALFTVIFVWGIANVGIVYCSKILGVNVVLFSCISFASGSLVLLLFGGYGKLARETLRSKDTWIYGLILFGIYILLFLLFSKTSATEGSLLIMLGMNFSLLISWFFFGRTPLTGQLIGNLVVAGGLLLVLRGIDQDLKVSVCMLTFSVGLSVALRVFVAEGHNTHSTALASKDPKAKLRVVAFVMFIVSLIFTAFTVVISVLKYLDTENTITVFQMFPDIADYLNPATVFAGVVYGALLMGPLRYLEFASSARIKAENYLAVTALAPASTLFWEWSTNGITGLELKTITNTDVLAGVIITIGAFVAAISQIKSSKKKNSYEDYLNYSPQSLELVEETRELIANSLEHFKADIKKTAKALGIPIKVIGAVLEDSDKVLTFKKEVLRKVASNYRKKVANSDALTGLVNRIGFMTALKAAKFEADQFSLLMIDLNKFKPVNDTYGHAAGDFVIQEVGKRLHELFKRNSLATRLSGDEFCLLLIGSDKEKAKQKVKKVKQELEKDIFYEKHKINISGSIGVASYPEDTKSTEEMLKIADKEMYRDKGGRRR